jgi:hypothetical protein
MNVHSRGCRDRHRGSRTVSLRRRLSLGLSAAAIAATVAPVLAAPAASDDAATSAWADESIIQVSDDPFTNAGSQHRTEVEPDTFAFGSTWVSAFQAGLSFATGSSGIGYATSADQGHSFVQGVLPGVTKFNEPAGLYDYAADASVAFDRRHDVWLISYLAVDITQTGGVGVVDVLVSRSRDAVHWDLPVPVARLNTSLDKSWTVCDNSPPSSFYGSCYTEFNGPGPAFALQLSTSSDGGVTWGPPKAAASGNAGQPLVQPGGRVVVPFFGLCAGRAQLCAINSDDGGGSWTTPTPIAARIFHGTAPRLRTPPLPSAAVDREGRIYLVWKDCRFEPGCTANDLVLSTSDDGTHWSGVRRIPIDAVGSNVDHFVPGLGVDAESAGEKARLALTYYFLPDASCTDAPCEIDVGFVSSTDGGQTWSAPELLAGPMQLGWLPLTNQGRMVGDYISTSVLAGGALALPAFAVASQPDDGTFQEAIFTARKQLREGAIPVADDFVAVSDEASEDAP